MKVTEHRTKKDWASFMQEVLEEQYPDAQKVILVMDNLNTHSPSSFYEVFPPARAKALADRLEIHYTPKHASWLNIAEIELSVLARQGLAHNIVTVEELWKPSSELAESSQPASWHGELAVSYCGCAHQTQATVSCAAT